MKTKEQKRKTQVEKWLASCLKSNSFYSMCSSMEINGRYWSSFRDYLQKAFEQGWNEGYASGRRSSEYGLRGRRALDKRMIEYCTKSSNSK